MKPPVIVAAGILSCLLAAQAFACVGGQEWTKDANGLTVDVTDDTPTIDPGQPVHFDFGLYTKNYDTYGEPVGADFSSVEVAFMHGTQTVMQKTLSAQKDRELTGFDTTFPSGANLELAVQYKKGNRELASASFPVNVGSGDPVLQSGTAAAIAAGALLIALILGIAYMRGRKRSSPR